MVFSVPGDPESGKNRCFLEGHPGTAFFEGLEAPKRQPKRILGDVRQMRGFHWGLLLESIFV